MVIDNSMYRRTPAKSVQDYDNEFAQGQQNKLTLLMAKNQMQDAQRGREGENALARLLAGGGDVAQGLASEGFGKQSMAYTKTQLDATEQRGKIDKQKRDLVDQALKQSRSYLATVTTPEEYLQWHEANHLDPVMGPELAARGITAQTARASIDAALSKPGGFEELLSKSAIGIEEYAKKNMVSGDARLSADTSIANNTATNDRTVSEGALNRGVQVRGQNMTDARSRDRQILEQGVATAEAGGPNQAAFTKQFGKAESGFRWKPDGSSEAIPGGSKDIKAGELGVKAEKRAESALEGAKNVRREISDATKLIGQHSAGFGGWASIIPTSDARNLQAKLTSIKANIGFDRLQQMRDQSPTGGALGQVAVQELVALQSTIASLDQMQSPSELKGALAKVDKHYTRWAETIQQAARGKGGAEGSWGGSKPQSILDQADAILRGGK